MTLVYFDLETGGVEPQHQTIQLAAVAMRDDAEVGAFEQKLAFDEAQCDPEALRMNHYTREAWQSAVTPTVAVAKFASWLRPFQSVTLTSKKGSTYTVARLAGYNAVAFDVPRLKALFTGQFFPCEYLVRDVLQRVLFYYDEHPWLDKPTSYKLSVVASHLGLAVDGAHDALADARLCAAVHRVVQEAW